MNTSEPPFANDLRRHIDAASDPVLLTLATVDAGGQASARMLVVRRLDEAGRLLVCSDARSRKNAHIRSNPAAEACLWFERQRTQFRLTGLVEILAADNPNAADVWIRISDTARALFVWPTPRAPRQAAEEFERQVRATVHPPVNFEVLRLVPREAERLILTELPHRRTVWTRANDEWAEAEVNP